MAFCVPESVKGEESPGHSNNWEAFRSILSSVSVSFQYCFKGLYLRNTIFFTH